MDANDSRRTHPDVALIEGDGAWITLPRVAEMDPFLMTVVSSTDLWMFLASNGGLTAGRVDAGGALFSYETVDRLYDKPGRAGSATFVRSGSGAVWCPLDPAPAPVPPVRRLSKTALGDEVVFEEVDPRGELRYRLGWRPSARFGWVREVELRNLGAAPLELDVLDGLLDVLPAQVDPSNQQRVSNLVDAYRHSELHPGRRDLALYSLSSLLTDRAEPAAALLANAVWRLGPQGTTHLSPRAVRRWWRGEPTLAPSLHLRGEKGAHLHRFGLRLDPGQSASWMVVLDAQLDHHRLAELSVVLESADPEAAVRADLEETRSGLFELARSVDGWQRSANRLVDLNHLSNALFNGLRGGFILSDGLVPRREVEEVLGLRDRPLAHRSAAWVASLPDPLRPDELRSSARATGQVDLERISDEIVPLAFGRRHGDPSRPWNRFTIRVRDAAGRPRLAYEGNWRDIFQNWEALAVSHPDYLPSFIAKFASASTVDGYNPYRISKEGVDWEVPDPHDPWSNIGYWGDHQVIYLLRLLEALERYRPGDLREMLDAPRFAFADVPYRIADFDALLARPTETITFDDERARAIEERVAAKGMDGRLVHAEGRVVHTHLWEKLLITLGAKLSNLVLDGGIWMNTQRPEWNDANNALPGAGLSVVTLAHTLRLARFMRHLAAERRDGVELSADVHRWAESIGEALTRVVTEGESTSPEARRWALEAWGRAYSAYRARAYGGWTSARALLAVTRLLQLLEDAERVLERSLLAQRRSDGLFHAYNTMELRGGGIEVHRLPLMLEGQVAALDAQVLSAAEAARLVEALFASGLYRPDQKSFLLYPDETLPDFEARNLVPEAQAMALSCVRRWLESDDRRVLYRDPRGQLRFEASLRNAMVLEARLEPSGIELTEAERIGLLELYEVTFGHRSFTGRSRGMYGFEGLGCIYWHMVAKLLVAVRETWRAAEGSSAETLRSAYLRIRAGLDFNKGPAEYGAFPTDAYSHSPGHAGAQQPGMTGQVKEQILTRFGELGVRLRGGRLGFSPELLPSTERLGAETTWVVPGLPDPLVIPAGGVGFMYAGVPVVMLPAAEGGSGILCVSSSGARRWFDGDELDEATTREWLSRRGGLGRVEVRVGSTVWPS